MIFHLHRALFPSCTSVVLSKGHSTTLRGQQLLSGAVRHGPIGPVTICIFIAIPPSWALWSHTLCEILFQYIKHSVCSQTNSCMECVLILVCCPNQSGRVTMYSISHQVLGAFLEGGGHVRYPALVSVAGTSIFGSCSS